MTTIFGADQGGTGQSTYTLGDLLYGNSSTTLSKLAGNTTSTKKFLSQTGTGSISAAIVWSVLTASDVGLGNVENTALSTWAGTTNITTLGTISPLLAVSSNAVSYWNGSAYSNSFPGPLTLTNIYPGGYDCVLQFQQATSTGVLKQAGLIGLVGTGAWTNGNDATQFSDMYFAVRNNAGGVSERIRITSTGNVGIGTTSPASALEVDGDFRIKSSAPLIWMTDTTTADTGFFVYADAAKWNVCSGTDVGGKVADLFTITRSTGNVGIGTSSPAALLDVFGTVSNFTTALTGRGQINVQDTSAYGAGVGPAITFSAKYDGSANTSCFAAIRGTKDTATNGNADGRLMFFTSPSTGVLTERLRIDSSGNVGIGTTSPTAGLDSPASTTTNSGFRIRSGTAPTSPNDGDIWYDGSNLKIRVGGTTKTII